VQEDSFGGGGLGEVAEMSFSGEAEMMTVEGEVDDEAAALRDFLRAAAQLSEEELREFVEDHVNTEMKEIRKLPPEQRPQAFRALCAEWHPDKCPAIAGLATEIFQRLQCEKSMVLKN